LESFPPSLPDKRPPQQPVIRPSQECHLDQELRLDPTASSLFGALLLSLASVASKSVVLGAAASTLYIDRQFRWSEFRYGATHPRGGSSSDHFTKGFPRVAERAPMSRAKMSRENIAGRTKAAGACPISSRSRSIVGSPCWWPPAARFRRSSRSHPQALATASAVIATGTSAAEKRGSPAEGGRVKSAISSSDHPEAAFHARALSIFTDGITSRLERHPQAVARRVHSATDLCSVPGAGRHSRRGGLPCPYSLVSQRLAIRQPTVNAGLKTFPIS